MGISLIYFGKLGGGTHFAKGVFNSLKSDSTRIFVSNKNEEFNDENVLRLPWVPTGVLQNILFFARYRKRKRLLDEISLKIRNDIVIFLMPHPLDFALRKSLKSCQTFTVIHDAKKHSGDFWPMNYTIRKLGKSQGTKIFLSNHVKEMARKFTNGPTVQLPLVMHRNSALEKFERDIDVAFLGRHKKYKNIKFQLDLIKHFNGDMRVFFSAPKAVANKIGNFDNVVTHLGWLETAEFESILSRTKTLVLTHREASQSGLVLDAVRFGACPIVPNIEGINEQTHHFNLPWVYNVSEIEDAEKQIKLAISNPVAVYAAQKVLKSDSEAWLEYFRDWI